MEAQTVVQHVRSQARHQQSSLGLSVSAHLSKQEKARLPGLDPAHADTPPRTNQRRSYTHAHTHMAGGESGGSDLLLLDVFGSPYAQRVRIALAEKGLSYERAEEDIAAKSDLLRRSNPAHGKVPVLLHAGRPVCESLVILEYLDDAFPATPPLLPGPADPHARARARFWADYAGRAHHCGKRLWLRPNGDGEEPEPEARAEMLAVLRALDAELGGREFFGGEAFGFVDAAAAPFAAWFLTYERHGRFAVAEECPGLAAWAARCARRGSVADNVYPPEKVYQLVLEYRQWVLAQK